MGGLQIPTHTPREEDAGLNDPIDPKHGGEDHTCGGTPNPNTYPQERGHRAQ